MDTFVDSSWYFMRYIDAHNDKEMVSGPLARQWLPVDVYIGGIEHGMCHVTIMWPVYSVLYIEHGMYIVCM